MRFLNWYLSTFPWKTDELGDVIMNGIVTGAIVFVLLITIII